MAIIAVSYPYQMVDGLVADGNQVMAHLDLGPGRDVGNALDFLLELRLEEGQLGEEEATRRLDAWWAERQAKG